MDDITKMARDIMRMINLYRIMHILKNRRKCEET